MDSNTGWTIAYGIQIAVLPGIAFLALHIPDLFKRFAVTLWIAVIAIEIVADLSSYLLVEILHSVMPFIRPGDWDRAVAACDWAKVPLPAHCLLLLIAGTVFVMNVVVDYRADHDESARG